MNDIPAVGPTLKAADLVKQFFVGVSDNVPFFVGLAVAAAVLSLAPDGFLPGAANWRWLFLAIALFAVTYLIMHRWDRFYLHRQARWQLKHLGADEREVLQQYLLENKACGYFGIKHGTVSTLIGKGILIYSSGIIFGVGENAVAIQPYALIYLRKHPHLVGLTKEQIGTKKPSGPLSASYGLTISDDS